MTQTKPQAGVKEWLGLVVIVLVTLLIAVDISVLGFAVPAISAALQPTATQLLWIMDIYSFVLAGMLITMGWVGDRFGRRRVLIMGAAMFGVASALAAFATSPEMLIGARALLGLGAATLTPTTLSLIRTMFRDPSQRKTAIAAWSSTLATGAAVGPIVGGLMLNHFWWGSVFLINTPVMVLVLILAPILLPERRDPSRGKMDLVGVLLSLAGILPLIYGGKELVVDGYSPRSAIIAGIGVLFLGAFIVRQRLAAQPLLDLKLFRNGGFSGSILVNLTVMLGFMGIGILLNQYLQLVHGMSPFKAALWCAAAMPGVGLGIAMASMLSRRIPPRYLIGAGMLLMAVGFLVVSQLQVNSNVAVVIVGMGLIAAGMIASKTLTAEIVVTSSPPAQSGAAVATSETFTEFGSAMGFAMLGSIAAAVFHSQMAGVNPAGLPAEATEAAHNTIGGAVAVAGQLPEPAASGLLASSREAFTHGVQITGITGAIGLVVLAVVAGLLLRKVPIEAALPRDEHDDDAVDLDREPIAAAA
jgi:DHA2 family multidrug resistance protein-like MFS transporter